MAINITDGFNLSHGSPIDSRISVANTTPRTDITYTYPGLKVYQADTMLNYVWNDTGGAWELENKIAYTTAVGGSNKPLYVDNTGLVGYLSSILESKKNIENINDTSWLLKLNPVQFNFRKKEDNKFTEDVYNELEYGLIAEDVEKVNPEICIYDETNNGKELKGVNYNKLISPILKIVQDQQLIIEDLKRRLEKLE